MHLPIRPFIIQLALLLGAICLSLAVGSVFIPPDQLLSLLTGHGGAEKYATILFQIRFPRTMLICLTGAALGGSGTAYQGLFRNPLAEPYLIGVASGAGLGAVIAMSIPWANYLLAMASVPFAAFCGAIFTVLLVYSLARVGKSAPVTNLILAGVAFSAFANALMTFIMLRTEGELHRAMTWMLGGSAMGGWQPVLMALPYVALGLGGVLVSGHWLNVLQFGDEQAQQLGLPVERVRRWIIAAASLSAAAAVSFSGLIGFVGLIVPHLIRILTGSDYRTLIPLSILGGATLLLLSDVLARVLLAPAEIPVGLITALAGAPFFLWVLRRSRKQALW